MIWSEAANRRNWVFIFFAQHQASNRISVAEGVVSSLSDGCARLFASVCFAGFAQVLGFFIHVGSVAKHMLTFYGESFSEVDIWN